MDSPLKQRLIGAAVLAALAIIFLPMLLKGPDVREPDAAAVPLSMPAAPGQDYETRELPLTAPEGASGPGGVLGMKPAPADLTNPDPGENPRVPVAEAPVSPAPTDPAQAPAAVPAAQPAAEEAPIAPGAVAAGNYVVNIGTFGNLGNAAGLADKLRAAKLPVVADRISLASGTAMRIRVGPYADRAAAEAARLRAESITGAPSKVVVLDAAPRATGAAPVPTAATKPEPAKASLPANAGATKPVAPAVVKPVAVGAGFAVQLSAPSVEADANALRDRARALGFSSFVQRVDTDSGLRYRVRVGPVADRASAETMRDAVNSKLGTKGIVVANP